MIKEAYCSYEVARLLKEKGFNEPCDNYYEKKCSEKQEPQELTWDEFMYSFDKFLKAPTHQMAMAWLREVHGIHIQSLCPFVDVDTETLGVTYNVVISNLKNYCLAFDTDIEDLKYKTYEDSIEAGIKYCLENLIMDYETNKIITQEELDKMGEELSNYAELYINQQFKITNDMDNEKKATGVLKELLEINQRQEISKDLEEAARKAATWHSKIGGEQFFWNDYHKFIAGANWQKEQMIGKACEWLKNYRQETFDGTGYIPGIVDDKTIDDFRKAMEAE